MADIPLKQCSRKDECIHPEAVDGWLPHTPEYFAFRKSGRIEKQCYCCLAAQGRARYRADPQKYLDRAAAARAKDVERAREYERKGYRRRKDANPDYDRVRHIRWRVANRERYREQSRRNYAANPRRMLDAVKRWEKKNPERVRLNGRIKAERREARKRGLPNEYGSADWQRALDYFNGVCAVCARIADFWTVIAADHWQPLSKGGGTLASNMIPLCHARKGIPAGEPCCNNSKGNRDPEAWLIERFGKRKATAILKRINGYFDLVQ